MTKDRTLLDQILGLERLRAEYVRASGTDIADDVMLSVLVRALPKALQQHVQLQMSETSSYDQVRSMVISYERTTTSWSAGKIHSELGILSSGPSSNVSNNGVAPMEIDRVEKGKQNGKSKGKSKDKNNPKSKGKGKNEKSKGKSSQPSQRAATANDQCLHCGRYGHFKRDCWKLHGKPDSKKVNQVESQTATSTATSSSGGGPSISPPSTTAQQQLVQCVCLQALTTCMDL